MNIFQKVKLARLLSALWDRLDKEVTMGHGKTAIVALGAVVATAIVTKVSGDCPCVMDVIKAWPTYLTAGVSAGIALYLKSPITVSSEEKK